MHDSPSTTGTPALDPPRRPGAPSAAALELFYDLVFVAAVVVLSHSYSVSPTAGDLVWLVLVFALIWITWLQTSLLFNVHRTARLTMRLLVLAQMLFLVLAAVSASDGSYRHSEYAGPLLGVIVLVLTVMQWRAEHEDAELRTYTRPRRAGNVVAAVLLLSTPLWPDPWYIVGWLAAIAAILVPTVRPDPLAGARRDREHLVERFGAFTIIMLGESFVKTALTATEEQMEGLDLICLAGTFVIVFAIWWIYFADVPVSGPPTHHRGHQAWMLLHLPLHLAIVGIAVGTARVVLIPEHSIAEGAIPYLAIPLAAVLFCLALIAWLSDTGRTGLVVAVHLVAAVAVGVIGTVAAVTDPGGIEGTSVVLAAVMVLVVVAITRIRATAGAAAEVGGAGG